MVSDGECLKGVRIKLLTFSGDRIQKIFGCARKLMELARHRHQQPRQQQQCPIGSDNIREDDNETDDKRELDRNGLDKSREGSRSGNVPRYVDRRRADEGGNASPGRGRAEFVQTSVDDEWGGGGDVGPVVEPNGRTAVIGSWTGGSDVSRKTDADHDEPTQRQSEITEIIRRRPYQWSSAFTAVPAPVVPAFRQPPFRHPYPQNRATTRPTMPRPVHGLYARPDTRWAVPVPGRYPRPALVPYPTRHARPPQWPPLGEPWRPQQWSYGGRAGRVRYAPYTQRVGPNWPGQAGCH